MRAREEHIDKFRACDITLVDFEMRKILIGLLVLLIASLLALGGYAFHDFVTGDVSTPFTDVVVFVMALIGVLVALASLGLWVGLRRVLEEDLGNRILAAEETTRKEALCRMAARTADSFWSFYEEGHNKSFLNQAINMAEEALRYHQAIDLESTGIRGQAKKEKEKEMEECKCRIYNNLAWGYAERGKAEDTAKAHFFANYIRNRAKYFPEAEVDYLETHAYVLHRLPKTDQDKQNALRLIGELMARPDVKDEQRSAWQQRYGLRD